MAEIIHIYIFIYILGWSLFLNYINVMSRARNFVWYTNKIILVKFEFDKSTPSRASKGLKFYDKGVNFKFSPVLSQILNLRHKLIELFL